MADQWVGVLPGLRPDHGVRLDYVWVGLNCLGNVCQIARGQHNPIVSILASGPSCPGLFFSNPEIIDVAVINQLRWIEECGQ